MTEILLPDMSDDWAASLPQTECDPVEVKKTQLLETLTLVRQITHSVIQIQAQIESSLLSDEDRNTLNSLFKSLKNYDATAAQLTPAQRLMTLRALLGEIALFLEHIQHLSQTSSDNMPAPKNMRQDSVKIFSDRFRQLLSQFENKRLAAQPTGAVELELESMAERITEYLIVDELPRPLSVTGAALIEKHLTINEYLMNLTYEKKWALLLDLKQEMQEFLEKVQ